MKFYTCSIGKERLFTINKIFLIMKITIILMISFLLQVKAEGYAQKINLSGKNITLEQLFNELKKQSGYDFVYNAQMLKTAHRIDINVANANLPDVLNLMFANQPLTYVIDQNTIIVKKRPAKLISPETSIPRIDIRGTVTDKRGLTLPSVSVKIKGSNAGTTTDMNGKFTLNVPDNNVILIFSFVGFVTQEIAVRDQTAINVTLIEDTQSLGEVVVTALGISRDKKALAYSVTEVKGDEFTQAREINLGNALSGRVAGVNATSTATGPGGSSRVVIRGNGSLGGNNQPLYVINGIPMDNSSISSALGAFGGYDRGDGLNSINPDDIESISVLKGGTAAALYGSRAANGVILITTKSGKAQKGLGVELNSTYTLERPLTISDWQYEYGSGTRGLKPANQAEAVAYGRTSWGAKLDGSSVPQPDGISRPYSAQENNIKNFYDVGQTFSNTLALNGGNETANFRFSVSDLNNKGILPNSTIKRNTFNLNANATLAKRIVFEGQAQYNLEEGYNRARLNDFVKNPNAAAYLLATNVDIRTLAPGFDARGYETAWNDYAFVTNPYFATSKTRTADDRDRFIGFFSTRVNISDKLYLRGRVGMDSYTVNTSEITPTGILYRPQGEMNESTAKNMESNLEALMGYNNDFGAFSVNVLLGGNKMFSSAENIGLTSGLLNVPFSYYIRNGLTPNFSQGFSEYAINSLFGSADIGFKRYLYLTLTGRKDWFSTLAKNNNSLFYPSAGLSFVFSDMLNDRRPSWLTFGKLKASWAQVGGGAPNPYALNLNYTPQASSHLGVPLMSIGSGTIPNEALQPYTSTTTEGGLELRMFNNRIGLDLTLYNRLTTDDIVSASISSSSAYSNVLINVGEVRNRGVELMLSGTPVQTSRGFKWDVSYNMAYNQNTVLKISDALTNLAVSGAEARTRNGFVYQFVDMPFGMVSGFREKRDANGNIVYNKNTGLPVQGDFMPLGRGVPPLTAGITNSFSYKSFSLNFLVDGKFGASLYSGTNANATLYGLHKNTTANGVRESGVTVSGVDLDGQPFSKTIPAQNYFEGIAYTITDQFVYDADFIKLRQLTFGYSLPQSILAKTPFSFASLSLVARNLLMLYNQAPNVDPESTYNNSNGQGLESFGVPPARSFGLNLMVRF